MNSAMQTISSHRNVHEAEQIIANVSWNDLECLGLNSRIHSGSFGSFGFILAHSGSSVFVLSWNVRIHSGSFGSVNEAEYY